MHGTDSRGLPLKGIRVLDFTQVQFGPLATQTLADFGADVIKVERPGTGEISRTIDGHAKGVNDSASFLSLNRNKRSIALDMKHPSAIAVVDALLADCDVIVTNFRSGTAESIGLGYDRLHELFPSLIYASGTGYGDSGPLSKAGGQDMVLQSISGSSWHNRGEDGRPRIFPIPFVDFGAGMALAQAILLALIERSVSGAGQRVDVSLLDTAMYTQLQEYTQWMLRGVETNWERDNFVGSFQTADGWISVVGLFRPDPLRAVCLALGMEDLSVRPSFDTLEKQLENKDELWQLLDEKFSQLSTAGAYELLSDAGVLCGPVLDYDDVIAHPQTTENGRIRSIYHPELGDIRVVDNPIRMSAASERPFRSPPLLGQHSEVILREAGFDEASIAGLLASSVVHAAHLGDRPIAPGP